MVIEDTRWLTSELELAGGRFLKVLDQTRDLPHAACLTGTRAAEKSSALLPGEEVCHGFIACSPSLIRAHLPQLIVNHCLNRSYRYSYGFALYVTDDTTTTVTKWLSCTPDLHRQLSSIIALWVVPRDAALRVLLSLDNTLKHCPLSSVSNRNSHCSHP